MSIRIYLVYFRWMPQAIDNSRTADIYSERRVSSLREKETRQNVADIGAIVGITLVSDSATNERPSEEEATASDGHVARQTTSMELQTYKSLMPLLPAEEDRVEETPPTSIFVIAADVNHTAPDHYPLVLQLSSHDEEPRDRIDVAGG